MKKLSAAVPLIVLLNMIGSQVFGQTSEQMSQPQLRQELLGRLAILEKSFGTIQGTGLFQEEVDYEKLKQIRKESGLLGSQITEVGRQVIQRREVSFAVLGEYRKCDLTTLNDAKEVVVAQSNPPKNSPRRVFCIGPRGSFALGWPTLEGTPEIKDFKPENSDFIKHFELNLGKYLRSPYSLFLTRFVDMLSKPEFDIKRIEPLRIDGNVCQHVFFEWTRQPQVVDGKAGPKLAPMIGSFVVDPTLGYALRSYEYHSQDKPWMDLATHIEYQSRGASEDLPLPKRVEIISGANHQTITFMQIVRTAVPDSQFTLSAYGLPEMDRPVGEVQNNALVYWLGGSAVVLLGLAGWFRYRSRTRAA